MFGWSAESRLLRRLAIVASAAILLVSEPAAAAQVTTAPFVTRGVHVRAQPRGAPSPIVGSLAPGARVELLESVPYYYRVRLPDGRTGYVSKRYTDEAPSAAFAAAAAAPLRLHFIDVGQGDSTLVECPNGQTLLIDAGSTSGRSPDEVQQYISRVLQPHGGDLDTLIVSHPDADHYNLIPEVLHDVSVGRAWFVGIADDYDGEVFRWLQREPRARTVLGPDVFDRPARPNAAISCGAAQVWILAAAVEASASPKNAMSIVVMIRHGDFEAMITGDATHDTEDVILARYPAAWLDLDVLRVGHHGSEATSTSKRWADTLSPKLAIISAGYENTYGHPRQEVVDRLTPHTPNVEAHGFRSAMKNPLGGRRYVFTDVEDYREAVYSTAMSGTLIVSSSGTGFSVEAVR